MQPVFRRRHPDRTHANPNRFRPIAATSTARAVRHAAHATTPAHPLGAPARTWAWLIEKWYGRLDAIDYRDEQINRLP